MVDPRAQLPTRSKAPRRQQTIQALVTIASGNARICHGKSLQINYQTDAKVPLTGKRQERGMGLTTGQFASLDRIRPGQLALSSLRD